MRAILWAVLDTHHCDPQNWLCHTLCSHPACCMTWIEQLMGEYFEGKSTRADFQGGVSKTTMVITSYSWKVDWTYRTDSYSRGRVESHYKPTPALVKMWTLFNSVDTQSPDLLLYGIQLTLNQSLIHLVGEVPAGSMVDQFPDNPHISLLGCHHKSCLLSVLESNQQYTI